MSHITNKILLRKRLLQLRDDLLPEERDQKSERIADRLIQLPVLQSSSCVLAYMAFRNEVSLQKVCTWILKQNRVLALPRTVPAQRLIEVVPIDSFEQVETGNYGIAEPGSRLKPISPLQVDVVLIPGAAFDRQGNRLGYGGGYYDRFLRQVRTDTVKIGVCFEVQMLDSVPTEAHDLRMDAVITEEHLYVMDGNSGL